MILSRCCLFDGAVVRQDSSGLVLWQEIPDIVHLERLLPAGPDDGIHPGEGGMGKQGRQVLSAGFDAVFPLE